MQGLQFKRLFHYRSSVITFWVTYSLTFVGSQM